MLDDIMITLDEFNRICELAGITPNQAVNREHLGREGVVLTTFRFLTTDDGMRAPHRFLVAAGVILEDVHAMFIADSISWSREAVTEIALADVVVEGVPTRRARR